MERGVGMKLSVVIPARNEIGPIADTISEAVDALERSEIDYEILVIDDSSTDGTAAAVQELAQTN
jgi:dolichol-phosphate mannosyltransferase